MTLLSFRDQLLQKAGVSPSTQWLEDCCRELRLTGVNDDGAAASVLFQLLHHDLRDVVRHETHEAVPVSGYSPQDPPGILRRNIQASLLPQGQGSDQFKATLPSSFRLLVQVEELLDVSQNAQTRLRLGPNSSHDVTPVGNQQQRCLKLLLVDGYDSSHGDIDGNTPTAMVGMELARIPNLSTNSRAGLKVLLQGPITLRHGVLLLTPANTHVLGGHVPSLVQIQRQALQAAQKAAGVGVDPTIRALIGNQREQDDLLAEDVDEGEGASSDVAVVPERRASQVATDIVPLNASLTNTSVNHGDAHTRRIHNGDANGPPVHTSRTMPALPPRSAGAVRSKVSSAQPGPTSFLLNTVQSSTVVMDGAQRPVASTIIATANAPVRNPYSQSNSSTSSDSKPLASPTMPIFSPNPQSVTPELTLFVTLRNILQRARDDAAYYRHLWQQQHRWTVQLRQYGPKLDFNVKKRENRLPHQEKYEFFLVAKYGDSEERPVVTCRVSGDIMGPYFVKTATEIRTLNKGDNASKQEAQEIVKEGGKQAQVDLYAFNMYEASLWMSPDTFFANNNAPQIDGAHPILVLHRRLATGKSV